jgi:hypothetical protein
MKTKLILRFDDELINRAETYAKKSGKSVSQIVADYFSISNAKPNIKTSELTPLVRSLKGSHKGANFEKEDYHKYLDEKYL